MRRTPALFLCALLALAPSCSDLNRGTAPRFPAPVPNTPLNVVRLLEWAWDHRDCEALLPLFTDDYRFEFAISDSAGNAYRDAPWDREDELAASCNLFANASDVQLEYEQNPETLPDDRPGKDPKWHKLVRTAVSLQVTIGGREGPEVFQVNGHAKFYTVRGDSAAIPPDLVAQGFGPDSTRWWIDRWEDETLPGAAMRANPVLALSWGAIKARFR